MQPWEPLRALATSVTVTWTPSWNPWCAVGRYELDARRPAGAPLRFADLEPLQYREGDAEDELWPGDAEWTLWQRCFTGAGRAYTFRTDASQGHAVQFRVRACGVSTNGNCGCSSWSSVQTTHTLMTATLEKVNFQVRGMGKNAPDYTVIEVNQQIIYQRRDETGLVLAVFSRLDFSLRWLRTYDTHRLRNQSVDMARDLRRFNHTYFVVVASTIAWEWHASQTLVRAMEFCGAYHFGQWAHIFAEQPHYASNMSDLQQVASQDEFGHPYAFIGIPGIGTAMGWESLMYNSGHYMAATLKVSQAVIRGIAYYDYISRMYRLQDVVATKAELYLKSTLPKTETLHNPVPARKVVRPPVTSAVEQRHIPYIGTLQNHITKLIEANNTVPPYNFAFVLMTSAKVLKVDPRPRHYWVTELERLWEGPSMRYWPNNGSLLFAGLSLSQRSCRDFVYHGYTEASPEKCGPNMQDCCPRIDAPNLPVMKCGTGVVPTLCRNNIIITRTPIQVITR